MDLPTIWFVAIGALWIGYLLLEGFDLGVGMHMLVSARSESQRRVMLNSIGPVWDGNEVWLLTAGAGTFAAFPLWYASLFSTLYIPLTLALLALIFRAVAIEYRGKGQSARWIRFWTRALGVGSFVAAFCVGAMLALTTTGLPIDADGNRVGGPFAWLTPYAVLGGLAVIGFCLVHAATFLGLKTLGAVREQSQHFIRRYAPFALLPIVAWVLAVQLINGKTWTLALIGAAVIALVFGLGAARHGREGRAFVAVATFLALGAASIFASAYPVVLPSTIDPAFSLTVENASSGDYTLGVMTWVTAFSLPLILLYQGYTYWVFRRRLGEHHLPESHPVVAAVAPVERVAPPV